jgi:hypothetical protein
MENSREILPVSRSFRRLQHLHRLLWNNNSRLRDKIFLDSLFSVPTFDKELNVTGSTMTGCRQLTLEKLISEFDNLTEGEAIDQYGVGLQAGLDFLLPNHAEDSMLVRPAYEESYAMLCRYEDERPGRMKRKIGADGNFVMVAYKQMRALSEKAVIFTGQPGIGKSWFLAYILVERLLKGQPTILQVLNPDVKAINQAKHYLFDNSGVRLVDDNILAGAIASDSTIWALADCRAAGMLAQLDDHEWLVVVASSPRIQNYKALAKEYSIPVWYMPVWDWDEIAAVAMYVLSRSPNGI